MEYIENLSNSPDLAYPIKDLCGHEKDKNQKKVTSMLRRTLNIYFKGMDFVPKSIIQNLTKG